MSSIVAVLKPPRYIALGMGMKPKRLAGHFRVRCATCSHVYETYCHKGRIARLRYCRLCKPKAFRDRPELARTAGKKGRATQLAQRNVSRSATLDRGAAKDPMSQRRGLVVPASASADGSNSGEPLNDRNGPLAHGTPTSVKNALEAE